MCKTKKQTFPSKVKECVDFIYNITTEQADGYRGGFASFDNVMRDAVTALVNRGVVSKEFDRARERTNYIYKWIPAMAPNKTLYGNIVDDIRRRRRDKYLSRRVRKAEMKRRSRTPTSNPPR